MTRVANQDHEEKALLLEMLRIPSPSGGEAELAAYLRDWLGARGVPASVDAAGNLVARIGTAAPGTPRLLLLGHLDTVSGHIPVRCENGRIFGRGAVDAKGPLAAFISTVVRLGRAGRRAGVPGHEAAASGQRTPPPFDITLVGAVEEETSTSRGARHLLDGPRPDWVVVGEPSGWASVVVGYKGRLLVEYRLDQEAAHAAARQETAAEAAAELWSRVQGFAAEFNQGRQGFDRLDCSLRSLEAGLGPDGLSDRAAARVSFRLPPGFPVAALEAFLESARGRSSLSRLGFDPAVRCPKSTPLVRAFLRAIRAAGGQPTFKLKTGTSDMNVVCPAWGVAGVAYGPGDSRLDHTPREHVLVEEYLRAIGVLERALGGNGAAAGGQRGGEAGASGGGAQPDPAPKV